ncbi:hypothetical protein B7494_g324 [Chlorociboria aeruginascens]|nr:hypothetical protein B7494_g324 [Chlorociboria aeruginascens]
MAPQQSWPSASSNKPKPRSSLSSKKKTKKHSCSSAASNSNDTQIQYRGEEHATHQVQITVVREWTTFALVDKITDLEMESIDGDNRSNSFQQPSSGYQYTANTPNQVSDTIVNQQTLYQAQQAYNSMQAFLDTPSQDQPYNNIASFGALAIPGERYILNEDTLELEGADEGDDGWSTAYMDNNTGR